MTLVSQIITDAFRQSNLVAVGVEPNLNEQTEALRYLNRLVKSVFGHEAGEALIAFPIGRANISLPSGWPWWNGVPDSQWFVPKNVRVMLNLDSVITPLYLHPAPDNGSRFAAIDVAGNLATYPVTVSGNGRLIEGATSIMLDVNSTDAEWFYREDLANWVKYAPLIVEDAFPFPEEFDDFFITMLAIRLNPSYGIALDEQSNAVLARSRTQLRARYSQNMPTFAESGLVRMSRLSTERDAYRDWGYGDPGALWAAGWPWYP